METTIISLPTIFGTCDPQQWHIKPGIAADLTRQCPYFPEDAKESPERYSDAESIARYHVLLDGRMTSAGLANTAEKAFGVVDVAADPRLSRQQLVDVLIRMAAQIESDDAFFISDTEKQSASYHFVPAG